MYIDGNINCHTLTYTIHMLLIRSPHSPLTLIENFGGYANICVHLCTFATFRTFHLSVTATNMCKWNKYVSTFYIKEHNYLFTRDIRQFNWSTNLLFSVLLCWRSCFSFVMISIKTALFCGPVRPYSFSDWDVGMFVLNNLLCQEQKSVYLCKTAYTIWYSANKLQLRSPWRPYCLHRIPLSAL